LYTNYYLFAIILFGKEIIMYIFRASKTVNGQKIYAKDYGKKAFPIWVGPKGKQEKNKIKK
jgi:hypothetical protein